MYRYRSADLIVESDIDLPLRAETGAGSPDVIMRRGDVPDRLEAALLLGEHWEMTPQQSLYRRVMPSVMRVLVRAGREIIIAAPSLDADDRAFLVGSAMGTLLHQRGAFLLHAAALQMGDGAVLILGDSGAGKSTSAAAMAAAGHAVLADDLCVVAPDRDGRLCARSDGRPLKVSREVAARVGLASLQAVSSGEDYVATPRVAGPLPIVALVVLAGWGEEARLERLETLPALAELRQHIFRPMIVALAERETEHFVEASRLIRAAPVFTLVRPRNLDQMSETVALLRQSTSPVPERTSR